MDSAEDTLTGGLPHSEIPGSTIARISPGLFAACHVLHRLSVPRHPPDALLVASHATPNGKDHNESRLGKAKSLLELCPGESRGPCQGTAPGVCCANARRGRRKHAFGETSVSPAAWWNSRSTGFPPGQTLLSRRHFARYPTAQKAATGALGL